MSDQYPVQEGSGGRVACDPEGDQVSAELSVSEESVVIGGGEESSVEVSRKSPLSQSQLLHLSSCLLASLLQYTNNLVSLGAQGYIPPNCGRTPEIRPPLYKGI